MIRGRRVWAAAVAAVMLVGVTPALAQAGTRAAGAVNAAEDDGGLPAGWRVVSTADGNALEWRSPRYVPPGNARVEFHADGALVGVPEQDEDGRTFRLPLKDAAVPESLSGLQVVAGGRRLDQPARGGTSGARAVTPPAQLPAGAVDPGKPGSYATKTTEYALDSIRLPGYKQPVEMRGVVVAPKGATGKRPVALFLHGRHATCYVPGQGEEAVTIDWPCAAGAKPIPSHRGYLKDQKLLASQGYVTVSVSANGINGQDNELEDAGAQGRSSLVRAHLARWADWAERPADAPAAVRDAPKADLSKVLLVGHSRGGEGVNRAAMDSLYPPPADQDGAQGPARWTIRGTVLIGPTVFGQNPVPDVPSVTILPGCDGDVSDLQGEVYVDGTRGVSAGKALHSAVYMTGANHNFFNSEWTPGEAKAPASDDFWDDPENPDPVCSKGTATRLTAKQQHRAGATYIAAAARLFVAGDDRVRQLLDGTGRRAPSADPARVLTHAVGGARGAGFLPDGPMKVTGGGRLCSAIHPDPAKACLGDDVAGGSPHFAHWWPNREVGRRAVALKWSAPGAKTVVRPEKSVSLKGAKSLALRVIVPPNSKGTRLDVAVTDASGKRAVLGQVKANGLPGSRSTTAHWAQELRVPLSGARGVDLSRIAKLELTPRSSKGKAWLIDAHAWRPGTPAVRPADLTRVDIGRLSVEEGDSGERTYTVPVRLTGPGTGTLRMYVSDPGAEDLRHRLVTLRPGQPAAEVTFTVKGNTRFSWGESQDVLVKAVRGTVIGSYGGGVTVVEDDPMPEITVSPVADDVTEGQPLRWKATLSEPADVDLGVSLGVLPVADGPELSTKDVDPQWLRDHAGEIPAGEVPLSKLEYFALWAPVPPGQTSAELTVPTVRDRVAEPAERLVLQPTDDNGEPHGPTLTGTVRDGS